MSKHPLILSAERDLLAAQKQEIEAKHEAERAMRNWAFYANNLGVAETRLHYLKRFLEGTR